MKRLIYSLVNDAEGIWFNDLLVSLGIQTYPLPHIVYWYLTEENERLILDKLQQPIISAYKELSCNTCWSSAGSTEKAKVRLDKAERRWNDILVELEAVLAPQEPIRKDCKVVGHDWMYIGAGGSSCRTCQITKANGPDGVPLFESDMYGRV